MQCRAHLHMYRADPLHTAVGLANSFQVSRAARHLQAHRSTTMHVSIRLSSPAPTFATFVLLAPRQPLYARLRGGNDAVTYDCTASE
jgi:hypothetical protein